jgi:hypothetical protein
MPAMFQAPNGVAVSLYLDSPPPSGAFGALAKVHTKLRQNADKIANVIILVILH